MTAAREGRSANKRRTPVKALAPPASQPGGLPACLPDRRRSALPSPKPGAGLARLAHSLARWLPGWLPTRLLLLQPALVGSNQTIKFEAGNKLARLNFVRFLPAQQASPCFCWRRRRSRSHSSRRLLSRRRRRRCRRRRCRVAGAFAPRAQSSGRKQSGKIAQIQPNASKVERNKQQEPTGRRHQQAAIQSAPREAGKLRPQERPKWSKLLG